VKETQNTDQEGRRLGIQQESRAETAIKVGGITELRQQEGCALAVGCEQVGAGGRA
jgi:hypothetical protein